MLSFILGFAFGGVIGIISMALACAASDAEKGDGDDET